MQHFSLSFSTPRIHHRTAMSAAGQLGRPGMTAEKLETFINDYLRADLAEYEKHLNRLNAEIMEFVQLKNMADAMQSHLADGFKTQVNIGGNCFVEAVVSDMDKMLINVGLEHYVEFTLPEAVKFCTFKVRMLTNQADVIREESIKTRANIKLALMCLADPNSMMR